MWRSVATELISKITISINTEKSKCYFSTKGLSRVSVLLMNCNLETESIHKFDSFLANYESERICSISLWVTNWEQIFSSLSTKIYEIIAVKLQNQIDGQIRLNFGIKIRWSTCFHGWPWKMIFLKHPDWSALISLIWFLQRSIPFWVHFKIKVDDQSTKLIDLNWDC